MQGKLLVGRLGRLVGLGGVIQAALPDDKLGEYHSARSFNQGGSMSLY